mgnify:FL=1
MLRTVSGFIFAVLVTYLAGTLFISQVNLASIIELGMVVDISVRIDAALHDLTHMYDIYLPVVVVALLIAFSVATGIIKFVPDLRLFGYVLAGFVGLVAIHVIAKMVLGMTGIAATRSLAGLLLQGVAGAAGGWMFHWRTRSQEADST